MQRTHSEISGAATDVLDDMSKWSLWMLFKQKQVTITNQSTLEQFLSLRFAQSFDPKSFFPCSTG